MKEEEIVAKQFHLLDGLFDVHRLEAKPLGANEISQSVFVEAVELLCLQLSRLEIGDLGADRGLSCSMAARAFVMDPTNLPLQLIEDLIDGLQLVGRSFLG